MKKQLPNLRKIFVDCLIKLAKRDKDIILLTGDVGYSYFERFQEKFPKQFINCGVIEQTMMGIVSGLALSGKKPYVYSMVPFITMRCYEQLRNDVCYHNANVKILGVQGNVYYNFYGFSHNIEKNEDLKILKHLPNIKCYTPKTEEEVKKIILKTYKEKTPVYIRL